MALLKWHQSHHCDMVTWYGLLPCPLGGLLLLASGHQPSPGRILKRAAWNPWWWRLSVVFRLLRNSQNGRRSTMMSCLDVNLKQQNDVCQYHLVFWLICTKLSTLYGRSRRCRSTNINLPHGTMHLQFTSETARTLNWPCQEMHSFSCGANPASICCQES